MPPIQSSDWGKGKYFLENPDKIPWGNLPVFQSMDNFHIEAPFPPNEVWITRLDSPIDSISAQNTMFSEPISCTWDKKSVCELHLNSDTLTQLTAADEISDHGKFKFATVQAIWFTSSGEENISWAVKLESD